MPARATLRDVAVHRRVSAIGTFDILRATYRTRRFPPHRHEEFAIGVVEHGRTRVSCRGAMHVATAGEILIINPGEVHTGEPATEGGWGYRMLYPDAALVERLARSLAEAGGRAARETPFFPSTVIRDATAAARIAAAHASLERGDCPLEAESRLAEALGALVARHALAGEEAYGVRREPRAVRLAREYLEANFRDVVRLATLERVTGLSVYHVIRVFRAEVGMPPYAYVVQLRLGYALRLMREGMPLSRVALQAGFADQSHLTRHFKRVVGVPPGQYVRGMRGLT